MLPTEEGRVAGGQWWAGEWRERVLTGWDHRGRPMAQSSESSQIIMLAPVWRIKSYLSLQNFLFYMRMIHSFICKRGGWKALSMITKLHCEWRGRQPGNLEDVDLPTQRPSLVPFQLCDLGHSRRLSHFKFLICQMWLLTPWVAVNVQWDRLCESSLQMWSGS